MSKQEREFINKIIREAVYHGGDSGGAYYSNEEGLRKAIEDWLSFKGINCKYEIRPDEYGCLQIYLKDDEPERVIKGDIFYAC